MKDDWMEPTEFELAEKGLGPVEPYVFGSAGADRAVYVLGLCTLFVCGVAVGAFCVLAFGGA